MSRRCNDSWFSEYLKYTSGQESPELFHIFVGIAMISAMFDRDVKIDREYFQLYPNIYIILVAGTSKCHKSAAIGMGMSLLEKTKQPPRKFAQKITNERLIEFLGENLDADPEQPGKVISKASGIIAADELSSFLGKNAMDTGIITTLTDIYGSQDKWEYQTKGSGKDLLRNAYVTFLGASTAKWLRSAIPQEAVGGGFISRCMFLYQEEPKRLIPFPEDEIPEGFDELKENLIHDLNHISDMKGCFGITPEAKEWYSNWYARNDEEMAKVKNPDFFSRWDTFMLKLGMIISAARNDELVIHTQDFKMAEYYLDALKQNMGTVTSTLVTSTSELPTTEVQGLIKRRGSITHQKLMNMAKHLVNSEGLQVIIQTLEEAGQIQVITEPGQERLYRFVEKEED